MGFQLPTSTGDCRIPSINRMSTQVQLKMRWNGVSFCGRTHLFKKTVSFIGSFGLQRTESHPCPHNFFWCVLFCSSLYSGEDEWTMEQKYWYGRGRSPFWPGKSSQEIVILRFWLKDNYCRFSIGYSPNKLVLPKWSTHRPSTCLRWCWTQVRSVAGGLQGGDWMPQISKNNNLTSRVFNLGHFKWYDLKCTWVFFCMKIVKSIQILWKNRCIQSTGIFLMVHEQIQRTSWDA